MSWYEYSDMFDKAQEKGQYRCYIFDMKESKRGYDRQKFYNLLKYFKEKLDKNIIHTNKLYSETPCIVSGDIIMLLTKRGNIEEESIYKAFKKAKEESDIDKDFHYLSGYYETDDWVEGNSKYYLGYCIQELEVRSKKIGKII